MWQTVRINAHANADGLTLKMYDVYHLGSSLLTISAIEAPREVISTTANQDLSDEVNVMVDRTLKVRHILVSPEADLDINGPFEKIVKNYDDAIMPFRDAKCIYHAVSPSSQLSTHFKIDYGNRLRSSQLQRMLVAGAIPTLNAHTLFFGHNKVWNALVKTGPITPKF